MLYHLFLIPFFLLFGSLLGMKVATVLLAACAVTIFYIVLRALHVHHAVVWALLALFAEPFSFRMALAKAPSVGAIFLFIGIFLLATRRFPFLALVGFFFVWAYGGFLLLALLVSIFTGLEVAHALRTRRHGGIMPRMRILFAPLFFTFGGIAVGLLIHPSFPRHFQFYWQQIIQIGLVNYHNIIGVGSEWYPLPVSDALLNAPIVSVVFLIGVILFMATFRRQTTIAQTTFCMAFLFLVFTLKSQRYIEYAIPWAILFAAVAWQQSGAGIWCLNKIHALRRHFTKLSMLGQMALMLAVLYTGIMIPGILLMNVRQLVQELHGGIPFTRFDRAGAWLRAHGTRGDIVFHNDWDDFPLLMYQTPKLRFIAGLDPTFFWRRHPDLYWQWVNITTGIERDRLLEIIQEDFHARFVFVDRDHERMRENVLADGRMKIVYEDDEVTIFRVPRE